MTSTTAMDEIEKKAQAHIDALEAATHWSSTSRRFKDALLAGIAALRAAPAAAGFHSKSRNNAENLADELLDVLYAAISDSGAAVHRRLAGCPIATDEITYEIWQDDMMVASSTDPKDASHYAAVYSQDGPVKVYTVLRSEWEGLNGGIVRGAGQMPAGDAQPVAWVAADTLNSPHPTCISSLAYMSQLDRERGREYVPIYSAETVDALQAENERLRAEVAEWKRVAAAQAELHVEAEARAERLAEALREIRRDALDGCSVMDCARDAFYVLNELGLLRKEGK